jgi:hypothetical protein
MTIMNWALRPNAALIICDTLVTEMENNRPMAFNSKAWVVPHRSLMICSLMWAYPAMTLYSNLALGFGPDAITDLPAYATEVLQAAAVQYDPVEWRLEGGAILFAWDESANELVGWRFPALHGYAAERIEADGELFLRPRPKTDVGGLAWYDVGLQQQVEDREIAAFDRNNLGGSLIGYEMVVQNDGRPPMITITNYGRLPHFEEQAADVSKTMEDMGATPFMVMQNG